MLESKGQASFFRLIRLALILGVDGELRELFSQPLVMESIEAIKRSERQRAPRRRHSITTPTPPASPWTLASAKAMPPARRRNIVYFN
jgi:hypothetical protein